MSQFVQSFVTYALVFAATVFAPTGQGEHSWGYGDDLHGPAHWGDLKPEFAACKNGARQSPIDITHSEQADLPPIQFDYKPSPLRITDNGHTIMVTYSPGSSISIGGRRYALRQFHFHRPSEEKINGKSYDMVVHLVHENEAGELAVIAVLLEKGEGNLLIRDLWSHLPKEKEGEESFSNINVDASSLLPADRGYYTFEGSLTTPPCTEGVTWVVLKHPVTMSPEQIQQFSNVYPHNARPVQPLNGRVVRESP
jgi:carbonic anhydrase